jgi:uncharacterized glyoxalase superfamily protein PhnB
VSDPDEGDPQVVPYLFYADAGAAADWLAATFDFRVRRRDTRADGSVRHAELELDHGGVIMLGSPSQNFQGPNTLGAATQMVRVVVSDLSDHRNRTMAAGVQAPEIEAGPPGWISYTVSDVEGHRWYFTEYHETS